jgi:hypothetical protein
MHIETNLYKNGQWEQEFDGTLDSPNTLITVFSTPNFSKVEKGFQELSQRFPNSIITGCSTTGEIYEGELYDDTLSVAISRFEKTKIVANFTNVDNILDSFHAGAKLANSFDKEGLKSLYVLSDGLALDGSTLAKGINQNLNKNISVTGGMASDNGLFKSTWVFVNREPKSGYASAIGFYGEDIHVSYASKGGWNKVGLTRTITACNSDTNTIMTIDDKPALELYKTYMGEHAKNLPASGLAFPLMVIDDEDDIKIRSLLAADEETQSIGVYGDIAKNDKIIFLQGNPGHIVTGAEEAAQELPELTETAALALTVSCIGRRSVLQDRAEEEVEIIKEVLGDNITQIGFYSYGEISTHPSGKCGLLNQTMTLALIWES